MKQKSNKNSRRLNYWRNRFDGIVVPALIVIIFGFLGLRLLINSKAADTDPPASSTTAALKPIGSGLYVRNSPDSAKPFIDHVFMNINWSDLEPQNGSFTGSGWGQIDSILSSSPNVKLRLRLFAGHAAPRWLDNISGPCVNIVTNDGETGCIPHYYKDSYLEQYRQLMAEVSRRYENNPRVLDVVNSACMTISAEPFILGGEQTGATMFAAGFTKAGIEYCLRHSTAIHMQEFAATRMSLATHVAWQQPVAGGIDRSWPDERALLQDLRNQYGLRILYQNNGLANQTCATNPTPDTAPDLYCYMKVIEAPKGFQQGCGQKVEVCDQASVIQHGLALGGCFVEHARFSELTQAVAQDLDNQLKAKCTSTAPPPDPVYPPEDINMDGNINILDFSLLSAKFGATTNLGRADVNQDGKVNILDFSLLAAKFGT